MRRLADRRFGIGADQVLVVEPARSEDVDFAYRIFNGGSGDEVEHCGNGARCLVRYVREHGLSDKPSLVVETRNRRLELRSHADGGVTVDMGMPVVEALRVPLDLDAGGYDDRDAEPERIEVVLVSMGNPHAVHFVDDVERAPVERQGPLVERHARFPDGVNAGFAEIVSRHAIKLRVHERGAGETLSCGTGACAAAAAAIRLGRVESPVAVSTRGGPLTIEWAGSDHDPMRMTGPAETVFEGAIEL